MRETRFVEGEDRVLRPWEVTLATNSDAAMVRFMRGLQFVHGHFTDQYVMGPNCYSDPRKASVAFMVWVPDGLMERFLTVAKPWEATHTKRIQLGATRYRCGVEGCPEDCPPGHHGGEEWRTVRVRPE